MAFESGASFALDEHLVTLHLRHMGKVRDRLALECCSRLWRAASRTPGMRQSRDVT
jgi:hypothetical protein